MKSSFKPLSLLLLALLLTSSFSQDPAPQPNDPHSVDPSVVIHDVSQPTPGNLGSSAQPIIVNTTTQPNGTFSTPPSPPQNNQEKINPSEDVKMKETIKKLISEMSPEQLQSFETQLAGDARRYYDELIKEEEKRQMQEQKWETEQINEMELEHQLSPSQKEKRKEEQQFGQQWQKHQNIQMSFHQYLFELDKGSSQDFRFTLPVSQIINFYGYTYENKNSVYSVPTNIEGKQPISVYVYENNHRIVYQKQFHFKYFGSFQGNENTTYLVRFVNPSDHKLIAFNLGILFEIGHSADKLTAVDVADHSRRIQIAREQIANRFQDIASRQVMSLENKEELSVKLDRYFFYSIVQILIMLVLCVMQVQFVRKLLAPTSVV